jgi:hypothetical protein
MEDVLELAETQISVHSEISMMVFRASSIRTASMMAR